MIEQSRTEWAKTLASLKVVEATNITGEDEASLRESDRLVDETGRLSTKLFNMPAPDLAALHWKLDYLLSGDSDEVSRQAKIDLKRLLPPPR